jgi:hypothetical protein
VLSLQSNHLCAAGGKALAEGLKGNQAITELNIASNRLGHKTASISPDMSGIVALADVIPDMRALRSLNLSSNNLEVEGAKIVAEAMAVTNCAIAVVLAPFFHAYLTIG